MIDRITCPCCKGSLELTNKKAYLEKQLRHEKQTINNKSRNDMIYNENSEEYNSKQLTYGFSGINI